MTTVVFLKRKGEFCGVTVSGHSGFDVCGRDIVCAAVSSAALLFANTVSAQNSSVRVKNREGYLSVFVPDGVVVTEQSFGVLFYHLSQIASQYPENLRLFLLNAQEEK